jgi:glycosyltransferase involved in cell wall biosynthesis
MSCETPVVATNAGALREVVGDVGAGLLVPPKDPRALRDALLRVIEDKELRREMGKKGRKRVEENFAWPVAAGNTLAVYEDVIKGYRRTI